ncbi:MAG TPA: beta-glucosidase BglX [Prolixibacteraceae bacterium]|nr:beta-glucosidase BglX [Prolixibacteraceae bacterium]
MKKQIRLLILAFMLAPVLTVSAQNNTSGQDQKMKTFIDQLMGKMTLEEKLGQLNLPASGDIITGAGSSTDIGKKIKEGQVGGLFNIKGVEKIRDVQKIAVEQSRLKIPLIFGMDVIHGYQTVFPIPLGMSCSWDMSLIEQSARLAAQEASADGICWTFSPMVDIGRDPRWGRMSEGSGEDPFLGSHIAKAMVRGYQGDDLRQNNTIMACVKHFALYGAGEAGRDYNTVDMSRIRMYNEFLPPYKAAVEAGVGSLMTSFNEIDGIPASANRWLMTEVLRNQWGFKGFVVTDYTAISEMTDHGLGDLKQVSALSLHAGIDMDMVSEGLLTTLKQSLDEGKVSQQEIDQACRRVLEAKYKLGLFEDPYRYCDVNRSKKEIFTPANRQKAREIAAQTFVLLKNDQQTLPLKGKGIIALVGPLASNRENMTGTWSVAADFPKSVSLLDGLKKALGSQANILYAKGTNVVSDSLLDTRISVFGKPTQWDKRSQKDMIAEAVAAAQKADVVIAAVGESAEMSGEASSRSDINLPENQLELLQALKATGKPVVMVLFTGRPLSITWEKENIPAILNVWFGGSEAGDAIADVLLGKVNPSGKLSATFPQNVGQIPLYYNHKNTGRPLAEGKWFQKFRSNYLDVSNDPLFPFGYGLSYTTFNYKNLKVSSPEMTKGGQLTVSVEVTNSGNYDGAEVVQLYLRDIVGSVTRPVKELKGFQKVFLKKGETKTVSFTLTEQDLRFYNSELQWVSEPGDFKVFVGTSSANTQEASFTLK